MKKKRKGRLTACWWEYQVSKEGTGKKQSKRDWEKVERENVGFNV